MRGKFIEIAILKSTDVFGREVLVITNTHNSTEVTELQLC